MEACVAYRDQFREEESMILELFYITFVTTFIAFVILGHALLFSAIYKGLRDDLDAGRRINRRTPLSDWRSQAAARQRGSEDENMCKSLSYASGLLLIIAMLGPVDAQEPSPHSQVIEPHSIRLPGTDYRIVLGSADFSRQGLLTAIETWLSIEFNLPLIHGHPHIELVPVAKIIALRYRGTLSDPDTTVVPTDRQAASAERDTVAVYSDVAQTIYLPESWTGSTPAELSVLVHEIVHHFQNVLGFKHECPQEREKLAYLAQDRWLGLFGRSLASDFELDPLSLLVKTKCFH
jgi:hypothetical protein